MTSQFTSTVIPNSFKNSAPPSFIGRSYLPVVTVALLPMLISFHLVRVPPKSAVSYSCASLALRELSCVSCAPLELRLDEILESPKDFEYWSPRVRELLWRSDGNVPNDRAGKWRLMRRRTVARPAVMTPAESSAMLKQLCRTKPLGGG